MIPDEAVEAAAMAFFGTVALSKWEDLGPLTRAAYRAKARAALEAALPTLLSHEREETRLAHLDAVVNAREVDRLERELDTAKADAWDEGAVAGWKQSGEGWNSEYPDESTGECSVSVSGNPYRK